MVEYDRDLRCMSMATRSATALFSLRPGESFIREAGNRGLHVNGDANWGALNQKSPNDDLVYLKTFYPGYTGGIAANGLHRYAPNLMAANSQWAPRRIGTWKQGIPTCGRQLRGSPRSLSSRCARRIFTWVERSDSVPFTTGLGDSFAISVSTDNGRSYKSVLASTKSGDVDANMDLERFIARRYAYWVKIEMTSALKGSCGLNPRYRERLPARPAHDAVAGQGRK